MGSEKLYAPSKRKNEPLGALPLLTCMKPIQSFCLSLLVFTGAAGAVSGQPFATNINPALTYYQAFTVAPDYLQKDRDYLFTNEWRGQKLPDRLGELLAGYDTEFRLVRQAAQSTAPCDWGIDWSAGPGALLPHLARIKATANTARLRAMWDLQHDRQSDAREDLLAALALGRNGARDGSLIGGLVEIAVEHIVCATVAENFNQFSPETLQQLAEGLSAPPARGTIAACIPTEELCHDWMIGRARELQAGNPGNDAQVMEGLRRAFDFETSNSDGSKETNNLWLQIVAAAGGTSDGVIKLLREAGAVYARLEKIEALPPAQYEEQMTQFSAEVRSSSNPLMPVFFQAVEKWRPREFSALASLAMVQAAVQHKLHGDAGLQSVANPCGQGPFAFRRFIFDGVDRGFELNAAYSAMGYPIVLIFVERDGPPFLVSGEKRRQGPVALMSRRCQTRSRATSFWNCPVFQAIIQMCSP